jgi:hypothetical protein
MAGGVTSLENLALACVSCSPRKGARTTVIDPATGDPPPLFHPRLHAWSDHFRADASGEILGLTAMGRGTVISLSHEPSARGQDSGRRTLPRTMMLSTAAHQAKAIAAAHRVAGERRVVAASAWSCANRCG